MNDTTDKTKPKRRLLSLSLRGLMLLVLALSLWLGWIVRRARVQREAVAVILHDGGSVWLNAPWSNKPPIPPVTAPGPVWMRRLLGWEYFDKVTAAQFFEAYGPIKKGDQVLRAACLLPDLESLLVFDVDTTDEVAQGIGDLTNLKSLKLRLNGTTGRAVKDFDRLTEMRDLTLESMPLQDQDLRFLKSMTKLEVLRLSRLGSQGLDRWLENLRNLKSLRSVELYSLSITSEGLRHIGPLTNLEELYVRHAKIARLDSLRSMTKLQWLDFYDNPVYDEDLKALKDLPELHDLNLGKTKITAQGLKHLARLPKLASLHLDDTSMTDAGLIELGKFPKLRNVFLRNTLISPAAIAEFRKSHPQMRIH